MSDATPKLNEALAKAQAELSGAKKDSENPHFRSKYADLASVWEAWQKVGPKHGLSITQTTQFHTDGPLVLVTTLRHTSGEVAEGYFPLTPSKPDMQGYGSAMTYARRYALAAMVGVAPEDDDGEAAVGRTVQSVAQVNRPAMTATPTPRPVAAPRPVAKPSAKPGSKEGFVREAQALMDEPPHPALTADEIPF